MGDDSEIAKQNGDHSAGAVAGNATRPLAHEHRRSWTQGMGTMVPLAVAVASLLFSFYIWYENNREPEVELSMPDRVRVTQGFDRAWLYLQPRFVSTSPNDRVDVIESLSVEVSGPDSDESVTLTWDEQGIWIHDPDTRALNWQWEADPSPLVVSPSSPQHPTGLFLAPPDWFWSPGRYQITAVAARASSPEPLRQSVTFDLTTDQVATLEANRAGTFLEIQTST